MVECQRGATNGNNLILVHYGNGTATDKERYHSRYRRRMGTFAFDAQTSDVPGRAVSHGLGYWMTRSVPRRAQDRRNRRVQPLFMARQKTSPAAKLAFSSVSSSSAENAAQNIPRQGQNERSPKLSRTEDRAPRHFACPSQSKEDYRSDQTHDLASW